MCGFVAQISKSNLKVNKETLIKMNAQIEHRGPDDHGLYTSDWFGLGFRRLSIIDISQEGHQPMLDESHRYVCVFNGELYNYLELKEKLRTEGVTFRSASDTEVLLKAYIQWGAACLDKFIGMFAFIIVDMLKKTVFIARDFPGIKPLYLTQDKHFWYFASEIKAFKNVVPFELNEKVVGEQFNFRYVAGDETLLENIRKILPGHCWTINKNDNPRIHKELYFDINKTFERRTSNVSFSDTVDAVSNRLRESFNLHTRSDVGYCTQLSGGVDSSLMTALLSETKRDLYTYSIELDGAEYDESAYQQEVAKRYQTIHQPIKMTGQDYTDYIEKTTYHLDSPLMHSGCVFLMKLCEEISHTSKVVLTGEGADELFGGYGHHFPSKLMRAAYLMQFHGLKAKHIPAISKLKTLKGLLSEDLIIAGTRYQNKNTYQDLFQLANESSYFRKKYANDGTGDMLSSLLLHDQNTYLTSVLDRQDKVSMANSVEARVPYCNQFLYREINPIKNKYKYWGGERKSILKKIAEPYLSSQLLYRRKNGLRLPLSKWYRDKNYVGRYLDLLTDKEASERGIYTPKIDKIVDQFRRGDTSYDKQIIILVNFEIWCRQFL